MRNILLILGLTAALPVTSADLAASGPSPAKVVRTAAAVACTLAHDHRGHAPVRIVAPAPRPVVVVRGGRSPRSVVVAPAHRVRVVIRHRGCGWRGSYWVARRGSTVLHCGGCGHRFVYRSSW